jgi:hypothetical protein
MSDIIRFSGEYVKLHGQGKAVLMDMFPLEIDGGSHAELVEYDTIRTDGSRRHLADGHYLLLLFRGDKGIPFTAFRRWTYGKMLHYKERIGQEFDVVCEARKEEA